MRNLLISSVCVLALIGPALANGANNNCNGNGSCPQNVETTNNFETANQGGQGGQGGNGGVGIGIGKGGDVFRSGNSHNKNTNTNKQGQAQGQSQGQAQSQANSIYWSDQRDAHSASSPALTVGSEVCAQSLSAGGQSPAFGISLGFTTTDDGCERRRNASVLFALGHVRAASELMCQDEGIREAMKAGGTPCIADVVSVLPDDPEKVATTE